MSPFTAQIHRIIAGEALRPCADNALNALGLLDRAVGIAAHRMLDIIALECLFVASLDGTKKLDAVFPAMLRQAVIARTAVMKSADPAAELTLKIERIERAQAMNGRPEAEVSIRTLVNQVRKAFPGLGIKVVTDQHQIRITSDVILRSNGTNQAFGSAPADKLGTLLVNAEQHLAEWAWLQTDRLRRMEVLVVRGNQTYAPAKRRISGKRRQLSAKLARLSKMEAMAA